MASAQAVHDEFASKSIISTLKRRGYFGSTKLTDTLQGSIWSSTPYGHTKPVILKVSDKVLVQSGMCIANGLRYEVKENIFKERAILKYLSKAKHPCDAIVKYINWFEDDSNFFLVEEHGGFPLFEFVQKAHDFIRCGKLAISEWHSMVQLMFKQMVDALDFMHRHRVAHFDISLENMLTTEVEVTIDSEDQLHFVLQQIRIKICDFGLVDVFPKKQCPAESSNGTKTKTKTDGHDQGIEFIDFTSTKKAGKTLYKSPEMTTGKKVDAAKNDIWCLGVTLFMMLIGGCPFSRASNSDETFRRMMNGEMLKVLEEWNRDHYVTKELLEMMQSMMKYEAQRISLSELKKHPWIKKEKNEQ